MLLNIDKPKKTAVLHEEHCTSVPNIDDIAWKRDGDLGRDGGWFRVTSANEAKAVAENKFPKAVFKLCSRCQKAEPISGH